MSIKSLIKGLWGRVDAPEPAAPPADRQRLLDFSTNNRDTAAHTLALLRERIHAAQPRRVTPTGMAMDGLPTVNFQSVEAPAMSDLVYSWFASQTFIGYETCAVIAQHWLVDKACSMPARDAIRQGYDIALDGAPDDGDQLRRLKKRLKRDKINLEMQEYVRLGRIFGIRIAIFTVDSTDPKYYERPFNPDGVTPGSYRGIVQVDPYWCMPDLDYSAAANPASGHYYEPTWWIINAKRYHRSHLAIFRTSEPADVFKPLYRYGGIPIPQQIMERVYAAERTANEAPQLAMSKRLTVWKTDLPKAYSNQGAFMTHLLNFAYLRDNWGVKVIDEADEIQQLDTALNGLDDVTMTQYQLVAAAARVPATKLLGTTPKGFNSTGDYEAASYREELETIQENDLTPLLDRHIECVLRSEIEPDTGLPPGSVLATVDWAPLDSPTAKEEAEINKLEVETDDLLVGMGAIDALDVRNRIRIKKDSGYTGIAPQAILVGGVDPLDAAIADLGGAIDPLDAATAALMAPETGGDPLDAAIADLGGGADPLDEATRGLTGDALDLPTAAGVIITRADGLTLFVKRSPYASDEPGVWAWPGGSIEPGELPEAAARRETQEETGVSLAGPLAPVGVTNGFVAFAAVVLTDPDVQLCAEHTDFVWAPLSKPPKPLHPGVTKLLRRG